MSAKPAELIRENVGIGQKIKHSFTEFVLHLVYIHCHLIFPRQLVTLRKVIDLLKLI